MCNKEFIKCFTSKVCVNKTSGLKVDTFCQCKSVHAMLFVGFVLCCMCFYCGVGWYTVLSGCNPNLEVVMRFLFLFIHEVLETPVGSQVKREWPATPSTCTSGQRHRARGASSVCGDTHLAPGEFLCRHLTHLSKGFDFECLNLSLFFVVVAWQPTLPSNYN